MDQGSTWKRSAVHNFPPTVTKFCVMWEGQALPHDTKFGNSGCEIVGRRMIFIWSLIHRSSWSGLIKVGPGGISNSTRKHSHANSVLGRILEMRISVQTCILIAFNENSYSSGSAPPSGDNIQHGLRYLGRNHGTSTVDIYFVCVSPKYFAE